MLLVIIVKACEVKEPKGKCNDPLSFSPAILNFDVEGGSDVVNSNSKYWDFSFVAVDDVEFTVGSLFLLCDKEKGDCELVLLCEGLYDPNNPGQQLPLEQVRCPDEHESLWFSVKVDDETKTNRRVFISVKPNDTGKNRTVYFSVHSGNCFTEFSISQAAE